MNARTVFFGLSLVTVIAAAIGWIPMKTGLLIGAGGIAVGLFLPDTSTSD
jgi:hypothetical protein